MVGGWLDQQRNDSLRPPNMADRRSYFSIAIPRWIGPALVQHLACSLRPCAIAQRTGTI